MSNKMTKNTVKKIVYACIIILFLVLTIGLQLGIDKALDVTDKENVAASASGQQNSVNALINSQISNLTSIAKTLILIADDTNDVSNFLLNLEKNLSFETIIISDSNGNGVFSDLEEVKITDNYIFHTAISGTIGATDVYVSNYTYKDVFALAVPIRYGGEVVGIVMAEYNINFLKNALSEYAGAGGYSFITDPQGKLIVSTAYTAGEPSTIEHLKNAEFTGTTYNSVYMLAEGGEWGGANFTLNGEEKIIEYRPLSFRNWTMYYVSDDLSIASVRNITHLILGVSAAFAFFVLVCSMYLTRSKNKSVKKFEKIAFYDQLTGLPNLVKFQLDVQEIIRENPNMKFTMQKMDIIKFRVINDIYGFGVGNMVLQKITETCNGIPEETFVASRVGADEFLMFSGNGFLENDDSARDAYEEMFKELIPELSEHEISFRYGRYFIEKGERDVLDIINKTTLAHTMARQNQHKKTWDYDDGFRQEMRRVTEISNKRKSAFINNEFQVYLQPKFNIKEHKVTGAEALVRWIEDDGNILLPDEFIPIFEQNEFVLQIDMHMFKSVCSRIKSWIDNGYHVVPVSVNFSRIHLRNQNFVNDLIKICDSFGEEVRDFIEIELTETAVTENADILVQLLDDLRQAGFSVAIDDFGAGYSSLGMLKDFKVDTLKLDQSFFVKNKEDTLGNIVISGIIEMAHNLDMTVVAEGIEFTEQMEFLQLPKDVQAQGFLFAKPMTVLEFEEKYLT